MNNYTAAQIKYSRKIDEAWTSLYAAAGASSATSREILRDEVTMRANARTSTLETKDPVSIITELKGEIISGMLKVSKFE